MLFLNMWRMSMLLFWVMMPYGFVGIYLKSNPEGWVLLTAAAVPSNLYFPTGIGIANRCVFQERNRIGWREIVVEVNGTFFILVQYYTTQIKKWFVKWFH
jgi:hypothetical protein